MVDDGGRVALDSPACVAAFAFYDDLIRNHSVAGAQDVDTTRATYFAGKAAMVIWSSFILDELAGLVPDGSVVMTDPLTGGTFIELMGVKAFPIGPNYEQWADTRLVDEQLDRLMSPIGLDIGARTPEETAISICAEIIASRTGKHAPSLRDATGRIHA